MNDLMNQIIEKINIEPQKWNQSSWLNAQEGPAESSCGTTACIAGWALLLSGEYTVCVEYMRDDNGKIVFNNINGYPYVEDSWLEDAYGQKVTEDHYKQRGAALLGLTSDQARDIFLFTGTTDPQQMTNHIKATLAGANQHNYEDACTC